MDWLNLYISNEHTYRISHWREPGVFFGGLPCCRFLLAVAHLLQENGLRRYYHTSMTLTFSDAGEQRIQDVFALHQVKVPCLGAEENRFLTGLSSNTEKFHAERFQLIHLEKKSHYWSKILIRTNIHWQIACGVLCWSAFWDLAEEHFSWLLRDSSSGWPGLQG